METNQKYNYTCPICGYTFESDKAEMEDRTCEKCQKGTYTIRSFASIRKVFSTLYLFSFDDFGRDDCRV